MTEAARVAIVTGGSRGIGRAIVEKLCAEGLAVVTNFNTKSEEAHRLVDALKARGHHAVAVRADLTLPEDRARLVDATMRDFGRIDVFVNNAGTQIVDTSLVDTTLEEWNRVLQLNLTAPFDLLRLVIPAMRAQGSGSVINITSNVTQRLPAYMGAYTVSKTGLDALTKILAREEGRFGIRVNAIAPGPITTDMLAETFDSMGPERAQAFLRSIPLGRQGEPSEIAEVVRFLISPAASYITGQTIFVNGGGPGNA